MNAYYDNNTTPANVGKAAVGRLKKGRGFAIESEGFCICPRCFHFIFDENLTGICPCCRLRFCPCCTLKKSEL